MKLQKLFYVILYFKRFNFSLLKLNNLLKKRENDHQEHLLNLRKFSLIVHTFSTIYASQFLHEKHKKEKKITVSHGKSHIFSLWQAIINFC